jgi:hypothetical protein
MKRQVYLAALFSAAFAVAVAAQTGSQADPQKERPGSKNQQQVTVSGCLAEASTAGAAGTGTAGTTGQATGSSRSEGQFMLTNARVTTRGTAGTSGTGTAGTAAGTASDNKFLLIGGNQQELKKYLNSEVEVRGTLQPRSDRGAGTGTATGETKSQSEMANVQRLRVTSVKQTSPTCTEK